MSEHLPGAGARELERKAPAPEGGHYKRESGQPRKCVRGPQNGPQKAGPTSGIVGGLGWGHEAPAVLFGAAPEEQHQRYDRYDLKAGKGPLVAESFA